MPDNCLPTFTDLRRRYALDDEDEDEPSIVSLAAFSAGGDPMRVIDYLGTLGIAVASLDDLHAEIMGLADEEELAAFRCQEGVAVSITSDGLWTLFID